METWDEMKRDDENQREPEPQWYVEEDGNPSCKTGYEQREAWIVEEPPQKGNGFAVVSLVLGIVGLVFVCCFFGLSFILAIIGLVFGILSLIQGRKGTGMAIAGTVLNGISFLLTSLILALLILFNIGLNSMDATAPDVFYDGLYYEVEPYESPYEEVGDSSYL